MIEKHDSPGVRALPYGDSDQLSSDVGEESVGERIPGSKESTDGSPREKVVGEGTGVCREGKRRFSSKRGGELDGRRFGTSSSSPRSNCL